MVSDDRMLDMSKTLNILSDSKNNLFQSEQWEDYQEALGNKTFRIKLNDVSVLLIKKPLYKDKSYLYCPKGPVCDEETWSVLKRQAGEIAEKESCVFLRVEPFEISQKIVVDLKLKKVGTYSPNSKQFSPMNTRVLDIEPRDDDILAQMKPKWRYNIKLGYRKGVQVRMSTKLEDLRKFHELSLGLKERGYTPFELAHYERMLYSLTKGKHIALFIAEYENKILSAILVTFYGGVATYLHGASSDECRELMPNHLAQWEAILESRRRGCVLYDFWGIAPDEDENHPWAGITRFKRGFGGEVVKFAGAYDCIFDKKWYSAFHTYNFLRKVTKNEHR